MWKEVMAAKEAAAASERAKRIGFLAHGGSLPTSLCLSAGFARRVSLDSAPFSDPLRNCGSVGQLVRRSL